MKKIIVSATTDLSTDNRIDRTCKALLEHGFEILLIGRIKSDSVNLEIRNYPCKRFKLVFQKGPFFYMEFNLRLFFFLLFQKKDILISNDLDTLLANYCCSKFSRRTKLLYDSHELFTETPELIARKRVRFVWLVIERYIFPKLKFIITVNQSINSCGHILAVKELIYDSNIDLLYHVVNNQQEFNNKFVNLMNKALDQNEFDMRMEFLKTYFQTEEQIIFSLFNSPLHAS